ncbi:MAG: hypothetical protein EOR16_30195 [Mesorhizobium sp.]|uniref:hypothetical protein n=1 Tax=Mesorhizobium sp. TaxID=1871066 RepID=UPI000FE49213|nr:hypothetical protein [Mesorhizobium sp.]RWI50532.1 MAG: hypothetical protein EOR16_30195 [Mesorhizobium sp.]
MLAYTKFILKEFNFMFTRHGRANLPLPSHGIDAGNTPPSRREISMQMKSLLEQYGELADDEGVVSSVARAGVEKPDTKL